MKKLAFILSFIASPALAEESKMVWIMALQFKGATMTVNYPTEEKCKEAVKITSPSMVKRGIGRADCIPVVQP